MIFSIIKSVLIIALLVYIGLGVLLYFFQQHFIFFPSTKMTDNTRHSLKIASGDEMINVWQINSGKSEAIIFFGGNAANAHSAIPQLSRLFSDKTVYLVDYRGYGGSTGKPSEQALYGDALVIYDHLKTLHGTISTIGQSLGSGIAIHLASERDINRLVLTTPYDSIESVAIKKYPLYPISWLLKEKFDSVSRVDSITANNTLILIAQHDLIIPREHSLNLVSAFKNKKLSVTEIPHTGHNTITQHPLYESELTDFLR